MLSQSSVLLEHDTPYISVEIDGVALLLNLDPLSNDSLMQTCISGIVVEVLSIKGHQTVSFVVDEHECSHTFLVYSIPTDVASLLVTDFVKKACVTIDFVCGKMSLSDISKTPRACKFSRTKGRAHTFIRRVRWTQASILSTGGSASRRAVLRQAHCGRLLHRTKLGCLKLKEILL